MNMAVYLIEPKAPLIIRSGRPFDGQAGADAARFPPPSTLAGALRTAHAESQGMPFGAELSRLAVAGPLPVRMGEMPELLVPKPADALYFWNADKTEIVLARAAPHPLEAGEGCDLPEGLHPVRLTGPIKGKPASGPAWWALSDLLAWRAAVSPAPAFDRLARNGWSPLPDEIRTHVGIDRATRASEAGRLFQTAGLDFWHPAEGGLDFPKERIGLIGCIDGAIAPGLITLGGERRLAALSLAPAGLWPSPPDDLCASIRKAGGLTLTLLTPASFAAGWKPPVIPGLKLVAAALDRWQPHSGWDLAQGKPRAGRKLVPAGAVYWYALDGADDRALAALWLAPLSDHEQDRCDGYGLALPRPWTPCE